MSAISQELTSYDRIFKDQTLPASGNLLSPEFLCEGAGLGLEIVGVLKNALTVPAGKNFSVELHTAHGENDSLAKSAVLYSVAAPADAAASTVGAGTEIFRFVPSSKMGPRMKIKLIDDTDLSGVKIDSFLVYKAR